MKVFNSYLIKFTKSYEDAINIHGIAIFLSNIIVKVRLKGGLKE